MNLRVVIAAAVLVVVVASGIGLYSFIRDPEPHVWGPEQLATLESMWIGSLPELPPDPVEALIEDTRRRGADPDFYTAGARWKREADIPDDVYFRAMGAIGEAPG